MKRAAKWFKCLVLILLFTGSVSAAANANGVVVLHSSYAHAPFD